MKKSIQRKRSTRHGGVSHQATRSSAFFDGRFLTATDLTQEQSYQRKRERRPVRRPDIIRDSAWRELKTIAACLAKPGAGDRVLLVGSDRNAKVLGARAAAGEFPLYRIDLGAILSKYIGETEKNLAQLFVRAEQVGAILFFDEADALFGKRSEVKDSHDRYANIENYLLQRLEDFPGTMIFAVRDRQSLDAAFLRRFNWIVSFPQGRRGPVRARKRTTRRSKKSGAN